MIILAYLMATLAWSQEVIEPDFSRVDELRCERMKMVQEAEWLEHALSRPFLEGLTPKVRPRKKRRHEAERQVLWAHLSEARV